ncbi:TauD/TfdA dioxygenase family protein [Sphingosinicella terrae]|uniref:TauD/TfdA dioxygenase family protein n=1 Tax=Sphingosinicella terrae TaxID=2172047 RepID=UPI000E0D87CE|nr:TauD/TfdA family dioxygenase [Sphingosinicella terrae]
MAQLDVIPVSDYIGAEIRGIDLSAAIEPGTADHLRRALADHGVIFFRDQEITPDQHLALARLFGKPILVSKHATSVPGYPEMSEVSKAEDQYDNIGGGWHADLTFHERPPALAILVARELPERGGDTLFAGMAAAFEGLSPGLRDMLRSLRAIHGNERVLRSSRRKKFTDEFSPEVSHPVVIRHPLTGRESLFINAAYTLRFDGWTERESAPLLEFLKVHGQKPEYQCRFQWRPGSIAIWDNIQVWHYAANDYQGRRRFMHRVAVEGGSLIPAGA